MINEILSVYHREIKRLLRFLTREGAGGVQFVVVKDYRIIPTLNTYLIAESANAGVQINLHNLTNSPQTGLSFGADIAQAATGAHGLIVSNLDLLIFKNGQGASSAGILADINYAREAVMRLQTPILIWLTAEGFLAFQQYATDFYTQRAGNTLFFDETLEVAIPTAPAVIAMPTITIEKTEEYYATVMLLKQQLETALATKQPKRRIASNIVLPLMEQYATHQETQAYQALYDGYSNYFDFKNLDIHTRVAKTLLDTKQYDSAKEMLEAALLKSKLLNRGQITATLLIYLADLSTELGDLAASLAYLENAISILKKKSNKDASDKWQLSVILERLGETHTSLGNLDKAIEYLELLAQLGKELNTVYPNNVDFKNILGISFLKLGNTYNSLGNLDKALQYYEDDLRVTEELHTAYPYKVEFIKSLAITQQNLGNTHTALGNLDKALQFHEEYERLAKYLHTTYPTNLDFKNGLAISYSKLGNMHTALGNLDKALQYYEEYERLENELHNAYPNNVAFKNGLAISYAKLGQLHLDELGKEREATFYFKKAESLWIELVSDSPMNVEYQKLLETVREHLASLPSE